MIVEKVNPWILSPSTIGKLLMRARYSMNVSRQELSDLSGVSISLIRAIESGAKKDFEIGVLCRLMEYIGIRAKIEMDTEGLRASTMKVEHYRKIKKLKKR